MGNRHAVALGAALSLIVWTTGSAAGDRPVQKDREALQYDRFRAADRHQRGRLDRDEFLDYNWARFSQYSMSGGESLSPRDFETMRCATGGVTLPEPQKSLCINAAAREFRRMTGSRGVLVKTDIAGLSNNFFARNDLDHDGYVSWEELTSGAAR